MKNNEIDYEKDLQVNIISQEPKCKEFAEIKSNINSLFIKVEKDAEKFYNKGNQAAGLRLRKALKEMQIYLKKVSKETLALKTK